MNSDSNFDYDKLLTLFEETVKTVGLASGVVARSVEEAEAFAYWCIENGFEEPRIIVKQL